MPPREPPAEPPAELPPGSPDSYVADGVRLAAEGRAIAEEAREILADALAAVLADEGELAALHPASARDAVEFLVRLGRMTTAEGERVVRRAGKINRGTG